MMFAFEIVIIVNPIVKIEIHYNNTKAFIVLNFYLFFLPPPLRGCIASGAIVDL